MATILLVDNDPLQAFARMSSLQKRFHHVQRASDAAEALCLVEQPQFASKLDLIISGLHMPGVDGPSFIAEMHARIPSVPVLVLGGASEPAADYDAEGVRFLSKPYAAEQMLIAATQMLDESHHPAR
jgi:two-component system cell cycle sensor histidine kinase/response regulator CckA